MNEQIKALQEQRAALLGQMKGLHKKAADEKRAFTEDEQTQYDAWKKERDDKAGEIDGLKVAHAREAELRSEDAADTEAAAAAAVENRDATTPVLVPEGQATPPGTRQVRITSEHAFNSFGHFLQAVRMAENVDTVNRQEVVRLRHLNSEMQEQQRAMCGLSETVPSDGGFLVQTDYAAILMQKSYTASNLLGRTTQIPISAASNSIKIPTIAESSRARGSRLGGIQVYWTAEGGTKADSKPEFGQVDMTLQKATALVYTTDELLADAVALGAFIMTALPGEFANEIDDKLVNGNGAGQPMGILNSACLVTVAKEAGQAANTLVAKNVMKMWSRCFAASRLNAVWLIHQDVEPELYSLDLPVGTGGLPVYLPPGGLADKPYGALFGRPVIPCEWCQTIGTVGDIILADWSQYLAIEKGGLESAMSIHVRFVYDESVYRFVRRINGQPWWASALTPARGTNTTSPFVALAAR